jgi:6-phosphogluconolactonase
MRRSKRSVISVLSSILIISLWLAGCGPTNGLPPLTGEFLYISNEGDGTISEFSIDTATGLLTNVGSFNSTAPVDTLFSMAVHPTNEFIYAADTANFVLGFDIGDQGASGMIFLRNSHVKDANSAVDVAIAPNGKFLYAASSPNVSEYSIDQSSGALKSIGTVSSGASGFGLTVDSTGNYAYVAGGGGVSEYVV